MSKPYGMTATFQIIRPTHAQDKVWEAVQAAIGEGWEPKHFMQEAREAWSFELNDRKKAALKEFEDKIT